MDKNNILNGFILMKLSRAHEAYYMKPIEFEWI